MPIQGIQQPDLLPVSESLRLRKYDGIHDFALDWYQNRETLLLVDGKDVPYTPERLTKMYHYLNDHGELYFIELLRNHSWAPVGDVTFWQDDMPIVIGDHSLRGKGIGRQVVTALIQRARALGYTELSVDTIYDYNTGSRKMFEACGFRPCEATANGHRYRLVLSPEKKQKTRLSVCVAACKHKSENFRIYSSSCGIRISTIAP